MRDAAKWFLKIKSALFGSGLVAEHETFLSARNAGRNIMVKSRKKNDKISILMHGRQLTQSEGGRIFEMI
ncbi:MAG: hypothetical protein KGY75_09895 [Candidatus Cloacimonetes bacterium]|nr:hypothetical protein [Candidatus Cloacimonadota bacterium]MBS3768413.1 hypothetical protein [Candidatus Cloacimonadota bacterium]